MSIAQTEKFRVGDLVRKKLTGTTVLLVEQIDSLYGNWEAQIIDPGLPWEKTGSFILLLAPLESRAELVSRAQDPDGAAPDPAGSREEGAPLC